MNTQTITYDTDYIEELEAKGNHRKATAYLTYLHSVNMGVYETSRAYASRWNVSNSTAYQWAKDFDLIIDQAYFFLLNRHPPPTPTT